MLDTNIVSEMIRRPDGEAARQAKSVEHDLCVSIIVAAELRYGCSKKKSASLTQRVEQFLAAVPVLSLDRPADELYGTLRADLETQGRQIGANDLLIAAHALSLGVTLVTANTTEFARVPGLPLANWT